MHRNIQQITQQFVDRLPENDQYYRLDELRSWGFPSFIIRRIKIELERNLEESLIIPKTDWANTDSDAVRDAWQKFVDAIRKEARLPASYGKTVIETAVADVMEMLIQPRKNVPNVIFRTDDQLNYDQLRERMQSVVVYPHFPKLILRYMQKKEKEELSKDRCREIISDADKKLTKDYSPLNWAQMLEPLFRLLDGEIDTNLLRLFYEDKNMPRVARKFDLMDDVLTRAELIEVLSSPELLNFEGYEDDQSKLFEDQPTSSPAQESSELKVPDEEEKNADKEQTETESTAKSEEETEESIEEADENEDPEDETEKTLNKGIAEEDEGEGEAENNEDTLNAVFKEQEEETAVAEGEQSEPGDENVVEDKEQQETKSEDGERSEVDDQKEKESKASGPQDNGQEEAIGSEEETPIWMRYMSEEEIEEYKEKQEQESGEEEVEEGFIDEPIIDLTNEDASDEEIEMLESQLADDRELFVEEIFRGSERAFDQAVEDIAAYGSWRDVSKYIEKEIFKRNLVDMYSEAAVEFTDRLQSYFLEKQNQNK